jgi:hypothetical protein
MSAAGHIFVSLTLLPAGASDASFRPPPAEQRGGGGVRGGGASFPLAAL